MNRRTLLASLGCTATAPLAGCLANEQINSSDTPAPNRVIEDWWDAVSERDAERFRDLYHADSPERDASYWNDEDWWVESFPPDVSAASTVEDRDLVEKTDTEAAVLDVFADPDEDDNRQPAEIIHKLRPDGDDWQLWTHELQEYIWPDDEPGERPADDLPDDCPTSTLADYDPPDELSTYAVGTFVGEYHETYVLNEMFSPHERDSIGQEIASITRHKYGYVVIVEWGGADYKEITGFEAERAPYPPYSDLPSVETLDSEILQEFAIEAAEQNEKVESSVGSDWNLDQIRQELESLPGDEDGRNIDRYVSVDGTPVRLLLWSERYHGDYPNMSTHYYVDSHVVRQSDRHSNSDVDTDPEKFSLLECRP